jgi:aminopeptidase N
VTVRSHGIATRGFRLFVLVGALSALAPSAQAQRQWFADGPTPLRYEISITPDVEAATFAGEVTITIETAEPLDRITMNARFLTVARASINSAAAESVTDADAQTLTLTPARTLAPGRHTLRIAYRGQIHDNAYGLFRVQYQQDGQTNRALATQFEPGGARRFAPMWDQPNRRAVFSLTVIAPSDQFVVGNMPVAETTPVSGNRTRTRFADTPSMPSYLLFLAVGDFERVTRDVDGVELGVVVRRGEAHRAEAALEAGEASLRYFTRYFDIPYPLPKLDFVAVPGAGGFGAMENWGAILYFDQNLLVDENSSETERQNVIGIVAHEVAHQWFGNLVTMNWWDDLWLNEGFASWMATKAIDAIHPDWNPWMAQLAGGTETAMALDARAGTHPVVQPVNSVAEASLAFDPITYRKGLAVIRMLEAYVGEEEFRTGVRHYINARRYGNARTEDLWSAIQNASRQPVLEIARSFTSQHGFPIITAERSSCYRRRGRAVALRQQRFAMDDASHTNERWSIPVVARNVDEAPVRTLLTPSGDGAVSLTCAPYLVNAGQSRFFRVRYDDANFRALTERFAQLESIDQLGLLLDYWSFGHSGDAPFTNYLELVSALPADADPVIVVNTATSMTALAGYARGRQSEAAVRAFGVNVLYSYFDRIGWNALPGENSNHGLMRAALIGALGSLGDRPVIDEARRRALASRTDTSALPAAIRIAALGVYAANATTEDYEDLLGLVRTAGDFVEQRRLWLLIASARDPDLAQRTLAMTLGEEIPRQVRTQVISAVAVVHPRLSWDFIIANQPTLEALFNPQQRLAFPAEIAAQNADPVVADELQHYAADFPEAARRNVTAAVAAIRLRAETISERVPAVEAWIARRRAGGTRP